MRYSTTEAPSDGATARRRTSDRGLLILAAIAIFLCWKMVAPFISAFTWALTLAIACAPLRRKLFARMPAGRASVLIIAVVVVVIGAPVTLLLRQLLQETLRAQSYLQNSLSTDGFSETISRYPWLDRAWTWVYQELDIRDLAGQFASTLTGWIAPAVAMSASIISETGIALLALFFFLRDEEAILPRIKELIPLSAPDTEGLFTRIASTVRMAVYGRLFIGLVQGFLGGVIFAIAGLPAPVLWGAVMSLLSLVPMLGAFVVWIPAALLLLATGSWIRALIVTVWGIAVINPVDNFLYPALVGSRLGLHPLILFIAFLGGLAAFGPTGLILGPCIVAFAVGTIDIWRERVRITQSESAA
jgi:predicted PurR-regulated permease PerM